MSQSVSHLRAIGFAVVGFTLWVLSDTCMKLAGEAFLPPYEVVAYLGLFGGGFVFLKNWSCGELRKLRPQNLRHQMMRASLSCAINLCNVVALKHLSLAVFYVTVFSAPMVIAVMAAFLLRERLNLPKILAIAAGFAGVVIAVDPVHHAAGGDWIGYAAALAGVACYAISAVWLRVMTQSETPDSLALFTALVEAGCGFGLMLLLGAAPVTFTLLAILFAMGTLGMIGNICNFIALKYTTAANVSQFHYTQIVTGGLMGYWIWRDVPGWNLAIGAAIIIAAGLYIAVRARKLEKAAAMPV